MPTKQWQSIHQITWPWRQYKAFTHTRHGGKASVEANGGKASTQRSQHGRRRIRPEQRATTRHMVSTTNIINNFILRIITWVIVLTIDLHALRYAYCICAWVIVYMRPAKIKEMFTSVVREPAIVEDRVVERVEDRVINFVGVEIFKPTLGCITSTRYFSVTSLLSLRFPFSKEFHNLSKITVL